MSRALLEVFPSLADQLSGEEAGIAASLSVDRVSMPKGGDTMRIYVRGGFLVAPRIFRSMERKLRHGFSGDPGLRVRFYERFTGSFGLEEACGEYWSGLLEEISTYHLVMGRILEEAERTFPNEDELLLTLPDTVFAREYAGELTRILQKVFHERLGLQARISLAFAERKKENAVPGAELIALPDYSLENETLAGKETEALPEAQEEPIVEKKPEKRPAPAKKRWNRAPAAEGLLYGRDISGELIALEEIVGELPQALVRGRITRLESRAIREDCLMILADITDGTDSISFKLFLEPEKAETVLSELKPGKCVLLKGSPMVDRFDGELAMGHIRGIKVIPDFFAVRTDESAEKRIELHCHTKMSEMDAVSEVSDIIRQAYSFGHPAIAITDHGVAQAFPEAHKTWQELYAKAVKDAKEGGKEPPVPGNFFKVIYGVEAYLVDDTPLPAGGEGEYALEDASYVVFDLETTGFSAERDRIIEIGAVRIRDGRIIDRFSEFVNPQRPVPLRITELTSITNEMVREAKTIAQVLPAFLGFIGESVLVAHNAAFDTAFLKAACKRNGFDYGYAFLDTLQLSRMLFPDHVKHTLDASAKLFGVALGHHHRAVDDAECTAEIFLKALPLLKERGITTPAQLNDAFAMSPLQISRLHANHAILLAKNDIGRINLYRLGSESPLNYLGQGKPKLPKSLLMKYREGLILGSACEAGELFRALAEGRSDEEVLRIADFYDYLEIQPIGNNRFMIDSPKFPEIRSEEDLQELNRQITALGERLHKPVCATCDVHFLNPEDEVYRRILMCGNGYADGDSQPPLFLRTTAEMLREFEYLGGRKAREVVIDNPRRIAAACEAIAPVRPDKCVPVIRDSDKTLRKLCYEKARQIYGDDLPKVVEERLEKELTSIISNGYSVMYIIAQKLVWKSMEDGYLVGSRGSVGSSLVAFMAGITEVNSLAPHYYCSSCHYSDFDSEEVRAFAGMAGADMPDRCCPVCGKPLKKDGFDIPFETFLGFKGDKEPDIDLNFSSEYQSKAHKYTEVIFGKGQTFRAGTITTLADKTAYGFVKKYFEERGVPKRTCEINRLTLGCTGVRKSTGQHPGGIVVLPKGENIYSFTPIQHPPKDEDGETITTHFDYHKIEHNLLKLDILGHDDPTMVRRLYDLTGLDPMTIPFDDEKVMSLFQSPEALGITSEDLDGWVTGTLGVPEFGTEFVMQMLVDTKPKFISDLIRISGLGHGTDVWLGNAQTLIQEGTATISECVCCRDDIMIYLIGKGMDPALSFTIMESVRKGKGVKPEWEKAMKEAGVPDWYIGSCKKIKYMFPKAHAAAYVTMAWRIGYYKIYYPREYYAAYFSIRASAFSYETMCRGKDILLREYERLKHMEDAGKKEQDELKDMRSVLEMYARGIEFAPIDLYTAHAGDFRVLEDGRIMPALTSIAGLGEKAAELIVEGAKGGPFLSWEDFKARCKTGDKTAEQLRDLGFLQGLSMTNQISIFDLGMR